MTDRPAKDRYGFRRARNLATAGLGAGAQMSLASIPVVGPPLAIAMSEIELRHIGQRLEGLEEELRRTIERIDQTKVDHAFLDTLEFTDIVIAALEAARRTSDREKLRMLASILAGAVSAERPAALDIEGLLVAIRDLPPAALRLAIAIDRQAGQTPHAYLQGYYPPTDFPDGDFIMNRLVAAGFAREFAGVGGMTYQHPGWQLTSTWYRLAELLKDGGWEAPA